MLSLFSTSSDKAGFRLQNMEVYNWGTFHDNIFKISPKGNNSLLTGANASGKSTFIDALLTLLVPVKKDRFYNQSSGVDKKGDRTEESYVYGHYGNIQEEGKSSTSTQMLRNKSDYSILLASFTNTDLKQITIFQVRWFTSDGKLNRTFGIAHIVLGIEDFGQFDGKGIWRKRLDKHYNANSSKRIIEFMDGPTAYAERMAHLFGMRSVKALSLFNQVVGVKVLDDLDEFIRTNMLEEQDAETEFRQLKESFMTLMDAKTNIEKAKEQIAQLKPIDEIATQLEVIQRKLDVLESSKEVGVYWFANKTVQLASEELLGLTARIAELNGKKGNLRMLEKELRQEETELSVAISSDEVGHQIRQLKSDIEKLERSRDERKAALDKYNIFIKDLGLEGNPSTKTFEKNKETAAAKKIEMQASRNTTEERLRLLKNKKDDLKNSIQATSEIITSLTNNNNNISGREAGIREEILVHIGATKDEVPFIGELIKVVDTEKEWEASSEKVLHNFALRLIVPEKYYTAVNKYVNQTNLKGRITYQRFKGFTSLGGFQYREIPQNSLFRKLEFKQKSIYAEWLEDIIANQYGYACVNDLKEFNIYEDKAITKEGLIKFGKGKHEKDDRPHVTRRDSYVLGWDNKEKIRLLRKELTELQEQQKINLGEIRDIEDSIKKIDELREMYADLAKLFPKYEGLDWQGIAVEIQEKADRKLELEKTNNKIQTLERQLELVQGKLRTLVEKDISGLDKEIYSAESNIGNLKNEIKSNEDIISPMGFVDVADFENEHPALIGVQYHELKSTQGNFQKEIAAQINENTQAQRKSEDVVKLKINAFKQPPEEITNKFKDWRSDVGSLPDSTHLQFISEYSRFLKQLTNDNLPKFEKKFDEYLRETITNKVGDFSIFFTDWADSIKENVKLLNDSLKGIDYKDKDFKTYIQIVAPPRINEDVKEFRSLLSKAIPNIREIEASIDGRKNHFQDNIVPLINKLDKEDWRGKVMDVRSWFTYKAEEFYKETDAKFKTYEAMGQLSGGEKAQMTYTILGSAIAYQFGLTKEGLQSNSFRFIAIDEAFKAQDEDKARYLITLCKQLHLQLLVVTPSDNIHIVENDISFVHFVERKEEKYSWLYDMPIQQFKLENKIYQQHD